MKSEREKRIWEVIREGRELQERYTKLTADFQELKGILDGSVEAPDPAAMPSPNETLSDRMIRKPSRTA